MWSVLNLVACSQRDTVRPLGIQALCLTYPPRDHWRMPPTTASCSGSWKGVPSCGLQTEKHTEYNKVSSLLMKCTPEAKAKVPIHATLDHYPRFFPFLQISFGPHLPNSNYTIGHHETTRPRNHLSPRDQQGTSHIAAQHVIPERRGH